MCIGDIFWLTLCLRVCVSRIDGSEAVYVVQTILPDIVAFVASLVTFTCCRVLPLHRVIPNGGSPDVDGIAQNHHGSLSSLPGRRNGMVFTPTQCKTVRVTLTMVMVAACGVVQPSILNTLYFVTTLVVVTLWALRIGSQAGGGRGLQRLRALLLFYTAAYLMLIYICQFPFAHQHLWVEDHLVIGGTFERYFLFSVLIIIFLMCKSCNVSVIKSKTLYSGNCSLIRCESCVVSALSSVSY